MPQLPRRPLAVINRAVRALATPTTPMLAQLVVTRRCNLSCGYCNEYDDRSAPLPVSTLRSRIDHLASLGAFAITLTGGEPLLHPELDRVIAAAVGHGMLCTAVTNGYPLTRRWIERLNDAGLTWIQLSIDNFEPNTVSQKSLSKIRSKLQLLRAHARFGVNVNAVLGACAPDQARALAREIEALGFYMTVGLMHDERGQLTGPLRGADWAALHAELQARSKKSLVHAAGEGWEGAMLRTGAAPYPCRAGSRYLYVDEFGKVSYCSQRRGEPGTDLLDYGRAQLRAAADQRMGCAPGCTLACVRRASALDRWVVPLTRGLSPR